MKDASSALYTTKDVLSTTRGRPRNQRADGGPSALAWRRNPRPLAQDSRRFEPRPGQDSDREAFEEIAV